MSLYRWSKEAKERTGDPWVPAEDTPIVSHRDAWMPKGDLPYFDTAARRVFHSRAEKRGWLKAHGMREAGLVNPDRSPE